MAYVIAEGTVVRTFFNGKGLTFKEEFTKRDGTEGASYFTAFFAEEHGLDEGDSATFKGNISVKLDTYEKDGETKYSATATLNNTKAEDVVYGDGASTPASAEPERVGF